MDIVTFIGPHLFYYSEPDNEDRYQMERALKCLSGNLLSIADVGWMVLVDDNGFKRGEIIGIATLSDEDADPDGELPNRISYKCWLVDSATVVDTEFIYELPVHLRVYKDFAKRGCLRNVVPLLQKKQRKKKQTDGKQIIFDTNVAQAACKFLLNGGIATFKIATEFENIAVGSIKIHKNKRETIDLTETLLHMKLVDRNKLSFQKLITSITDTYLSKDKLTSMYSATNIAVNGALTQLKNIHERDVEYMYKSKLHKIPDVKDDDYIQIKPKWEYLEVDEVENCVTFVGISTTHFNVRLVKTKKAFDELMHDIVQDVERDEQLDNLTRAAIKLHCCYLLKDRYTRFHCRVMITDIVGDVCEVLLVDFGNKAVAFVKELKYLKEKFIKQLPFQAIECRFFGVEPRNVTWSFAMREYMINHTYAPFLNNAQFFFAEVIRAEKSVVSSLISQQYSVVIKTNSDEEELIVNRVLLNRFLESPSKIDNLQRDYFNRMDMREERKVLLNLKKEMSDRNSPYMKLETRLNVFVDAYQYNYDGNWRVKESPSRDVLSFLLNLNSEYDYKLMDMEWSQDPFCIKIGYCLPESSSRVNYKVRVGCYRIVDVRTFKFPVLYKNTLYLYDNVEQKFHFNLRPGRKVVVKLEKIKKWVEWPRLLHSTKQFQKAFRHSLNSLNPPLKTLKISGGKVMTPA